MSNIRLHSKYGLNPTMPLCILCGEEKGEIALLGASYKEEAPKKMVLDVVPCDKCKEKYLSQGVLLIEAIKEYNAKNQEMNVPTGRLVVLRFVAFKKLFNAKVPKQKIVFVEKGLLDKLEIK